MIKLILKAVLLGCIAYGGVSALNAGVDSVTSATKATTQNTSDCFIYGTGC